MRGRSTAALLLLTCHLQAARAAWLGAPSCVRHRACAIARCEPAAGCESDMAALREWVHGSGGDVSCVRIGEVDGLRGGVVENALPALGTELMRVPAALGLTDDPDELLETPVGRMVGRSGLALLQPDALLALRLLHEASLGGASRWASYIALLPARVLCARHLTDEALLGCRSDLVLDQSMLARKYARTVRATLARCALADGDAAALLPFDEEELGWALDMVHSRSFCVDAGARGVRRFLVPIIDMLNHRPGSGVGFTYDDDDEPPSFIVEVKPGHAAPAVGEVVWLDYGEHSSAELLLMYGFVPAAPTASDRVELDGAYSAADLASAPGDAAMLEEKRQMLRSCRYDAPRKFELAPRRVDPAVVCALRLVLLSPAELDECGGNWNRPLLHAPVSGGNERRVAEALAARLRGMLQAEATTLEEDRRLVARLGGAEAAEAAEDAEEELDEEVWEEGGEEAEAMRCAVQLRANRKQILSEFLVVLGDFLEQMAEAERSGAAPPPLNLLAFMEDYMPAMRLL